MTETDKLRIKPLDGNSDYSLWRICVYSAKGLDVVFKTKNGDSTASLGDSSAGDAAKATKASSEQLLQASNTFVAALGDHALRVVRSVIGHRTKMMEKLNDR